MGFPEGISRMDRQSMIHYLAIEKLYEILDDFKKDCVKREIEFKECFISFSGDEALSISRKPDTGPDLSGELVGKVFLGSEKYFRVK